VSPLSSAVALAAFLVGAAMGGRLALVPRPHRGFLLAVLCLIQATFVAASAVLVSRIGTGRPGTLVLITLLAVAMGGQNSVVRRIGVPDRHCVHPRTLGALDHLALIDVAIPPPRCAVRATCVARS